MLLMFLWGRVILSSWMSVVHLLSSLKYLKSENYKWKMTGSVPEETKIILFMSLKRAIEKRTWISDTNGSHMNRREICNGISWYSRETPQFKCRSLSLSLRMWFTCYASRQPRRVCVTVLFLYNRLTDSSWTVCIIAAKSKLYFLSWIHAEIIVYVFYVVW